MWGDIDAGIRRGQQAHQVMFGGASTTVAAPAAYSPAGEREIAAWGWAIGSALVLGAVVLAGKRMRQRRAEREEAENQASEGMHASDWRSR